jgi:hypothetical protein
MAVWGWVQGWAQGGETGATTFALLGVVEEAEEPVLDWVAVRLVVLDFFLARGSPFSVTRLLGLRLRGPSLGREGASGMAIARGETGDRQVERGDRWVHIDKENYGLSTCPLQYYP